MKAIIRLSSIKYLLRGSLVTGECRFGPRVKVISSRLAGQVLVESDCSIVKATVTGKVSIGRHSYLSGPNIFIHEALQGVAIGRFCSIARGVQIQEYDHRTDLLSTAFLQRKLKLDGPCEISSKGPVKIGSDVWIGANAIITSGVVVGNGAVIAAGAVVTNNVPAYAVVAGIPARVIKYRFSSKIIEELCRTQWWDMGDNEIRRIYSEYVQS